MSGDDALVGNIRRFDNEIDFAGSEGLEGMKVLNIKPRLPSFEMSGSFTIHVLAQLDLRTY